MTARKDVVEKYIDGFRDGDHRQILSCLTEDVRREIYGHATIQGKAEFDSAVRNEATTGHPTLTIDRMIGEGDSVVAVGSGGRRTGGWRTARVRPQPACQASSATRTCSSTVAQASSRLSTAR